MLEDNKAIAFLYSDVETALTKIVGYNNKHQDAENYRISVATL